MASIRLQSKTHRDLLDLIDSLRSRGVSKYVDLPEIIVCGDQSAGKSSVLEAISKISFPTKDNLCTRFATELVLRRDSTQAARISIIPGPERTEQERERLSSFHHDVHIANPDLGSIVGSAKEAMGLCDSKVFSTDILRVELCGPTQPHLTLVDLPGIFRAGNRDQSVGDAATVRKMVCGYMDRPRSIVLAVVSAKSDFALQEVTEMTRELDPKGERTLGLITKPDTLDVGSDSEMFYFNLAQNKDVVFRLGWHVLMNRSYATKDACSAKRDEDEKTFFDTRIWNAMDHRSLGAGSLVPRLSNVLKDQILAQLPSLIRDVEVGLQDGKERLERLGTPRTTSEDQRRYLLRVAQDFTTLIKSAVDGVYNHPFFGSAKTPEGYRKRLRAVIQSTLTQFREEMFRKGESRIIIETVAPNQTLDSRGISRSHYIDEVKNLMQRSRGCELPGTFSPLVIGELFSEQCQPWKGIAVSAKDAVVEAVYQTIQSILHHVAIDETTDGIFEIIRGGVEKLQKSLEGKVTELLQPYYVGHPITYNHYLTDNVQKAQSARRWRHFEKTFKECIGVPDLEAGSRYRVFPHQLLSKLQQRTEVDMERYASELAVDYMQAYYKVRLYSLLLADTSYVLRWIGIETTRRFFL